MSASILSTLLLVSPASLPSFTQPPSLVEPESGAWAVVHAGQLWVCWSPGPECFERVVFDDAPPGPDDELVDEETSYELADEANEANEANEPGEPEEPEEPEAVDLGVGTWQLGFAGPRSLWLEHGDQRFRIVRGQRRARRVDEPAPVRLERISPADCGPQGLIPALINGQLSWREAPECAVETTAQSCVTRAGPRVRRPTPVRIRAGIEVARARAWMVDDDDELGLAIAERRRKSDIDVKIVVELRFDWQRRASQQRARALLIRRSEARLRPLPRVSPGPLADAELEAIAAIVCDGGLQ
ncbi:MAG: hypothetical protein R6X02_23760 [Enhygromyxa sp.]